MEAQWVKPQQSVFSCTELREEEEYCFVFFLPANYLTRSFCQVFRK